ncbi:LOW QUALITY PROTEIN: phosphoribosyltransferase domain-containing protein 1 [Ctenodactylus gundi]
MPTPDSGPVVRPGRALRPFPPSRAPSFRRTRLRVPVGLAVLLPQAGIAPALKRVRAPRPRPTRRLTDRHPGSSVTPRAFSCREPVMGVSSASCLVPSSARQRGSGGPLLLQKSWDSGQLTGYVLNLFTYPQLYYSDLECVPIPHSIIVDRIELLKDIIKYMGYCDIMVLCVLKGGYKLCVDLIEYLKNISWNSDRCVSMKADFIRLKSYKNDQSMGDMQIIGGEDLSALAGKFLNVTDVVGTGRTVKALLSNITNMIEVARQAVSWSRMQGTACSSASNRTLNPPAHRMGSLTHVAEKRIFRTSHLLVKRTSRSDGFRPDLFFFIPNLFVVGYALEYNEDIRDLNHIRVINEHSKEKSRV